MKKIFCLLGVTLAMFCVSCGNEKNKPIENAESSMWNEVSQIGGSTEKTPSESEEEISNVIMRTVQIPGKEIYVEFVDTLRLAQEAYTALMYADDDAVVGFFSTREDNYSGSLEDVIDLAKYEFIDDAGPVSSGWIYGAEIEVVSTESVEIAGRESVRFTGTVLNDGKWECHVYGYTFIIDGVPCAVIGLISDKNQQTEEMIATIDARVDEIAGTIRTTK